MATLRIFIMGSDTIIKANITNKYADLMIANFIKSDATYDIHKYNTDGEVDTQFYFCDMIFVITKEEL